MPIVQINIPIFYPCIIAFNLLLLLLNQIASDLVLK